MWENDARNAARAVRPTKRYRVETFVSLIALRWSPCRHASTNPHSRETGLRLFDRLLELNVYEVVKR